MEERTPSKNPKLRMFAIAAAAVIVALLFVVLLLQRGGASSSANTDAEPYTLDSSAKQVFRATEGRLAVASSSGLQLFDEDGNTVLHEIFSLAEPGLTVCADRVAAYDIGGTQLSVADFDGDIQTVAVSEAIVSASLNENGWLTVVTDATGYKGMVTVYDASLNAIYEWYSGKGYVMNAALSAGNSRLAVLCAEEGGSAVHLFSLDSEEERGCYAVTDELFADLYWIDGDRLCALSQTRLAFLNDKGELAGEYSYGGMYLYDYSKDGDGFFTLVLSQYRSGSAAKIVTVSPNGAMLGETVPAGDVESVSVCGKQVLLCGGGTLTVYNQQMEQLKQVEEDLLGVRRAILMQRGKALLVYDYSAQSYSL